jgi:hypothetical protein
MRCRVGVGVPKRPVAATDDDVHADLARLIKADFGEVIWRDRIRFGLIAPSVSPATGHTHLYDAVAAGKLSAVKWLVRLGGRVREQQDGISPLPCPWDAALGLANPAPMLGALLTSEALTPVELAECADALLTLYQRAPTPRAEIAAYEVYCNACRRIDRRPRPPRGGRPGLPRLS